MTSDKEISETRNELLIMMSCGTKSVCMVKIGPLDEKHSTLRVKRKILGNLIMYLPS